MDRQYGGAVEGEVGRVERKLLEYGEVKGLVVGAFGEVSEGLNDLVQTLALSRIRTVGLQKGREYDKGEMGVQVGRIRKILSVAAVKSQAGCLLSRLGCVGEGCVEAGRRRAKVVRWERRWQKEMEKEMERESVGLRRGRVVVRRGEFMED